MFVLLVHVLQKSERFHTGAQTLMCCYSVKSAEAAVTNSSVGNSPQITDSKVLIGKRVSFSIDHSMYLSRHE